MKKIVLIAALSFATSQIEAMMPTPFSRESANQYMLTHYGEAWREAEIANEDLPTRMSLILNVSLDVLKDEARKASEERISRDQYLDVADGITLALLFLPNLSQENGAKDTLMELLKESRTQVGSVISMYLDSDSFKPITQCCKESAAIDLEIENHRENLTEENVKELESFKEAFMLIARESLGKGVNRIITTFNFVAEQLDSALADLQKYNSEE